MRLVAIHSDTNQMRKKIRQEKDPATLVSSGEESPDGSWLN